MDYGMTLAALLMVRRMETLNRIKQRCLIGRREDLYTFLGLLIGCILYCMSTYHASWFALWSDAGVPKRVLSCHSPMLHDGEAKKNWIISYHGVNECCLVWRLALRNMRLMYTGHGWENREEAPSKVILPKV